MQVKTAQATMKVLLSRARREQAENIKLAQQNASATRPDQKTAYESRAFRGLIKGVSELLALARDRSDG